MGARLDPFGMFTFGADDDEGWPDAARERVPVVFPTDDGCQSSWRSVVISLALAAQVDQAEASLREMFGEFSNLRADAMTMNGCALVAVDVLAALSEAWQESVEKRLDLVTARLLAWQRIAGA